MRVPRVKNCRLSQKLKRILQSISFRSGTATRRCKTKACTEENAIAPHSKVALGARSGMAPAAGPLSSRSGFAAEVAPVAPAAPANNNDCFATSSSNAQSQPPGEAARGAAGTVLAAVRRANALHSTWWCRMDCLPSDGWGACPCCSNAHSFLCARTFHVAQQPRQPSWRRMLLQLQLQHNEWEEVRTGAKTK